MAPAPVVGDQPEPFSPAQHPLAAGLGQGDRLGVAAAPVGEHDRAAQGEVAAGRLDDGIRFGGQRHGDVDPPREELDAESVGQGDGEKRQCAGAASQLELASGEVVPRGVVAQRPCDVACVRE
jgi:hypothetical protein